MNIPPRHDLSRWNLFYQDPGRIDINAPHVVSIRKEDRGQPLPSVRTSPEQFLRATCEFGESNVHLRLVNSVVRRGTCRCLISGLEVLQIEGDGG